MLRCLGRRRPRHRARCRSEVPGLSHDEITALSSELWELPVFERRLAAVVLLQSNVTMLRNPDLTRLEGFMREARVATLADPLAVDVVGPLINGMTGQVRGRAESILDRWGQDPNSWLRRAAILSSLPALRNGSDEVEAFLRRARAILRKDDDGIVRDALAVVRHELAAVRPELISGLGRLGEPVK